MAKSLNQAFLFQGHQEEEGRDDAEGDPEELVGGGEGADIVEGGGGGGAFGCCPCDCGYDGVVEDVAGDGNPEGFSPVEQVTEKSA